MLYVSRYLSGNHCQFQQDEEPDIRCSNGGAGHENFQPCRGINMCSPQVYRHVYNMSNVQLSSDEKWVRRSVPLPTITDTDSRTVYVVSWNPHY